MMKIWNSLFLRNIAAFSIIFSCAIANAQEQQEFDLTTEDDQEVIVDQQDTVSDIEKIRERRGPFDKPDFGEATDGADDQEYDISNLKGMQLFEPADLLLTGIISSGSKKYAMVEDAKKKGYILKEGDLIGRRGAVTRIEDERVVITETIKKRSGGRSKNTIIMQLNTQGEF